MIEKWASCYYGFNEDPRLTPKYFIILLVFLLVGGNADIVSFYKGYKIDGRGGKGCFRIGNLVQLRVIESPLSGDFDKLGDELSLPHT